MARIVNIAHTAFYMLAAYCFYTLLAKLGLGFALAAPVSVLAVTLLALLCYRLVIEPVRSHESAVLIATIALALVFQELMLFSFGGHYLGVPSTLEGAVRVLGVTIPYQRLLILAVAAATLAASWFLLYRTRLEALLHYHPRIGVSIMQHLARMLSARLRKATQHLAATDLIVDS